MPDGAHKKVKLNVRVPPDKKQEWKDFLEGGETLSSLVRRAVDHEVRDEYVSKDTIDDFVDDSTQADIDLSSLTNQLDELQRTVEVFEDKLDTVSASSVQYDDEEIENLAMDLLHHLPPYPQEITGYAYHFMEENNVEQDTRESIKYIIRASQEDSEVDEINGTAQRLARDVREPTPLVREALCHLEAETTENVKSTIINGRRHWMRGL